MMILTVIFGLLAVGGAVVIYGTLAKNRWGINAGDVSCPRCSKPLPKVRQPQSLRQEMWGGWTCPSCGAEVDKWGRELHGGDDPDPKIPKPLLKSELIRQPMGATFFALFKGRSSVFWVIVLLLVLLNIWYDYYSPSAIVFDVLAAIALFVWYRKSRQV
jgi:hypothetical protein